MEQVQQPGSIRNLLLIARFELVRLFQTPRGLMSLAAFGVVWYFILRYLVLSASDTLSNFKEPIRDISGQFGLSQLLEWPTDEFIIFWLFGLMLFPLFTLLITSDQTSSDRSRGTLRFITLRATRDSIFFGRFLGQMLIQTLLVTGVLLATFTASVWNDSSNWTPALNTAVIMGINLLIVVLPYTAMMAFFSALVSSSKLAVVLAILSYGAIFAITGFTVYYFPSLYHILKLIYILPGYQLFELVLSNGWETLRHATIPLCQTVFFLLLGRTVVARSSL